MSKSLSDGKKLNWFVTGASRGLGRVLVQTLLEQGHAVVATSRNPDAWSSELPYAKEQFLSLPMDVTKHEQVSEAVKAAVDHFGRIDVLVNNAGYGLIGAIEEVSDEEIRDVFDTNVFGLMTVTRAVLPFMRSQRSGHIVNISSVGGFSGGTGSGIYSATKFAVEGLSESLAIELAPLGIHVSIVEPGQFRTDFLADSLAMAKVVISDYDATVGNARKQLKGRNGVQAGDPKKAAHAMIQLVQSEQPTLRLPLGRDCVERMERKLSNVVADMETWRNVAVCTNFEEETSLG